MKGGDPREFLTTKTLLEDVGYAADIGVDLFVLDDGWQDMMGDWFTNTAQLPRDWNRFAGHLRPQDDDGNLDRSSGRRLPLPYRPGTSRLVIRGDDGLAPTGRWNKKMFCLSVPTTSISFPSANG